jgi:hypothetical protein
MLLPRWKLALMDYALAFVLLVLLKTRRKFKNMKREKLLTIQEHSEFLKRWYQGRYFTGTALNKNSYTGSDVHTQISRHVAAECTHMTKIGISYSRAVSHWCSSFRKKVLMNVNSIVACEWFQACLLLTFFDILVTAVKEYDLDVAHI